MKSCLSKLQPGDVIRVLKCSLTKKESSHWYVVTSSNVKSYRGYVMIQCTVHYPDKASLECHYRRFAIEGDACRIIKAKRR